MRIPIPGSGALLGLTENAYTSYAWLAAIAVLSMILYQIITRSEDIISLVVGVRNPQYMGSWTSLIRIWASITYAGGIELRARMERPRYRRCHTAGPMDKEM
jgi:hypothetical protein